MPSVSRPTTATRCSRPRTVTSTFQKFAEKAVAQPGIFIKEQARLWADLGLLWQRWIDRALLGEKVEPVIAPDPQDKRFKNEAWSEHWLFDHIKQHYLLMSRCVQSAVRAVEGVDPHLHHQAQFYTRQLVNALSPANFPATNPVVLDAVFKTRGENLIKGLRNLVEDLECSGGRLSTKMADLSAFEVGKNVADLA